MCTRNSSLICMRISFHKASIMNECLFSVSGRPSCLQYQSLGEDDHEPPCRHVQTNDQVLSSVTMSPHRATQGRMN